MNDNYPKILVFHGKKGGVGKTTLSFATYCALTKNGTMNLSKVVMINCDNSSDSIGGCFEDACLKSNKFKSNYENGKMLMDTYTIESFIGGIKMMSKEKKLKNNKIYLLDLKGENVSDKNIIELTKLNCIWICPIVATTQAKHACINTLNQLDELDVPFDQIFIFFNSPHRYASLSIIDEYEKIIKRLKFNVFQLSNGEIGIISTANLSDTSNRISLYSNPAGSEAIKYIAQLAKK